VHKPKTAKQSLTLNKKKNQSYAVRLIVEFEIKSEEMHDTGKSYQ
jgi:hypothetical protein